MEFKLNKKITLSNGKELEALNLEFDSLSLGDLKTANHISKMISSDSITTTIDNSSMSMRLDPNLRIGIGFVAAIKGTPGLKVDDCLKLSMVDAMCLSEEALSSYLFR